MDRDTVNVFLPDGLNCFSAGDIQAVSVPRKLGAGVPSLDVLVEDTPIVNGENPAIVAV